MLSGGAAGLVSSETLRKEQEEMRRREKHNRPLEGLSAQKLNKKLNSSRFVVLMRWKTRTDNN